ncbi:MAG: HAMP domain-containing protein [Chloroflexi bacterium]|nr:HAMP domain-containing protein [Chloroflexota bacterium]
MQLRLSAEWAALRLAAPGNLLEAGLCLLFVLLILGVAWRARAQRPALTPKGLLLAVALAALGAWAAGSVWCEAQDPVLQLTLGSPYPIAALVPLVISALWLGVLPMTLVGLAVGAGVAAQTDHSLLSVLSAGLAAQGITYLLRQPYRGRTFAILRHPLPAALLVSLMLWPSPIWRSLSIPLALQPLSDGMLCAKVLLWLLAPALLAAFPLQIALPLLWPRRRPVHAYRVAPHHRSLVTHLSVATTAVILALCLAGAYAVNLAAVHEATTVVTDDLLLIAQTVEREIERDRDALQSTLRQGGPELVQRTAPGGALAGLWLWEPEEGLQPVSGGTASPPSQSEILRLIQSPDEWLWTSDGYLLLGAPAFDAGLWLAAAPGRAWLAHALPTPLPGAAHLDALAARPTQGAPGQFAWVFPPNEDGAVPTPAVAARGNAGRSVQRHLSHEGDLLLTTPLPAIGLELVAVVRRSTLLTTALPVSLPLLAFVALASVMAALVLPALTHRTLQPLAQLSNAASRASRGHLADGIAINGADEVGRLAVAVERLRRSLQARSQQLVLLSELAHTPLSPVGLQGDLAQLLRAALRSTDASAAAAILEDVAGTGPLVVREQRAGSSVASDHWMRQLDAELAGSPEPLFVERLAEPFAPKPFVEAAAIGVQALAAIPLAVDERYLGMLCLQYRHTKTFADLERGLLQALAKKISLLVDHVYLKTALQERQDRLQTLLNATFEPALILSGKGELLAANQPAQEAFGFSEQEQLGSPLGPALESKGLQRFLTRLGEPRARLTAEVATPKGETLYLRAIPFGEAQKRPAGWIVAGRDLSDLKTLDALKGDFIAGFSTDLKSPLRRLRGLITMTTMVGELSSKQRDLIERCVQEVDAITAVIDGLFELATIEAGTDLQLALCQLPGLVSEVVEEHKNVARERQIHLQLELSHAVPAVMADKKLLQAAIHHLLDNAIRFTPPGGQIVVRLSDEEEHVALYVSDTGIGIPADEEPRVFERFFRGRAAAAQGSAGNGLGLSIVRAAVAAHGGTVWLETAPGAGSTFTIALPKDPLPAG